MRGRFAFPLNIQLPKMELDSAEFEEILGLLQKEGFSGVELNLGRFDDPDGLRKRLAKHGLKLSMVASGAYAKANGLSLSSVEEDVRKKAVAAVQTMRAFAAALDAGVICGFIKGAANEDYDAAAGQMRKSLAEIAGDGAPVYLEATNHYEATLVNTVEEGAGFTAGLAGLCVLPDTYHMHMEECDVAAAMVKHSGLYQNLHLSDNTRYFPGFGAIDFRAVYRLLDAMGYEGVTALEGRARSLKDDIVASAAYLAHCTRGI